MAVESSATQAERRPKRRLREAALDDEQVQSPVTDAGNRALAIEADVADLTKDVAVLKRQADSLNERFDSFRDEIVARLDASEERIKSQVQELRSELRGEIAELRSELRGEIAGVRSEVRGEIAELRNGIAELRAVTDARFDGLREEMNARFESVEARLRIFAWLIGIGLTLYTATTVSLMVLLFRAVLV